jgi:hypothetical protein
MTPGDFVVYRNHRTYGIGHNPYGGACIVLQGYLARERQAIDVRLTSHAGAPSYPHDGGPNPEFEALLSRLRAAGHGNIWFAPDDAILAAWPRSLPDWAVRLCALPPRRTPPVRGFGP